MPSWDRAESAVREAFSSFPRRPFFTVGPIRNAEVRKDTMTVSSEFDLAHILAGMREPGTTLVFVDDTDFHGGGTKALVPDLRVLAAIKLDSERYSEIESALNERLRHLGQLEFHGAEVFNPKEGSRWRDVSISDRMGIFHLMSELVDRSGASMRYSYLSAGQYKQMRRHWRDQGNAELGVSRNAALKRVMLRSLQEELYAEGRPAMIMIDQDRARNGIERDASEDAPWLIGGGILTAPSSHVAGLQFADALSFGIGRRFRRAEQFEDDTASGLDLAALGPIAALDGRSRMVLAAWPGGTRDQSSSPVSSFQRPASTSVNPAG